jgi:hypothetical protein
MSVADKLRAILAAIQQDPGNRGLGRDPDANLFNACPDDFAAACRSLAGQTDATLAVVTGFWIVSAGVGETDGPLGVVYLARTLPLLGVRICLATDPFCIPALRAGLRRCGRLDSSPVLELPSAGASFQLPDRPTHVLAIERPGRSHTPGSIRAQPGSDDATVARFEAEVPPEHHDRYHSMRGVDISAHMRDPGFEFASHDPSKPVTIGIGDGGNEIGMGKVPWAVIRANISNGALIACRVPADYLIVAGVSNWGAYALSCGVAVVKGVTPPEEWFDLELERDVLQCMVDSGRIVDGVSGQFTTSVDGLPFEQYAEPLRRMREIVRA